jgi:hypothetical protein
MYSLGAFGGVFHLKLNTLALNESLETFPVNSAVVDEDVSAIFLGDKSITLGLIEPFYFTVIALSELNGIQIRGDVFMNFASTSMAQFGGLNLPALFRHAPLFINRKNESCTALGTL